MPHAPRALSRMFSWRAAGAAATAAAVSVGLVSLSAPMASATPLVNHCGSSYSLLKSFPITDNNVGTGTVRGYIDLYWSRSLVRNCAIARPVNGLPNPNHISVGIARTSDFVGQDDGFTEDYTQYAGPVSVYAPSCIEFYATIFYGTGQEASGGETNVYC